jgi:hypothetical protein
MIEDKYIVASEAAKEAIWTRNFVSEFGVVPGTSSPMDLYCDNSGAITQAKEPRVHKRPDMYYSSTISSAKSLVEVM